MKAIRKISCVVVFALAMTFGAYPQSNFANLRVKGESKLFQMPDIMEVSITISTKEMEYQVSIDQNLKNVDRLKQAVKSAKISSLSIKDKGQKVNEERRYVGGKSEPHGYRANYLLAFQVDAKSETIHQLMEAMKKSEVIMNYNAFYKLSPELLKSVEIKLIENAVSDAKEKAKTIAKASNCEILKILNINYGIADSPIGPVRFMEERSMVKADKTGADAFTNPDAIELTDQVEISFQIKPNGD